MKITNKMVKRVATGSLVGIVNGLFGGGGGMIAVPALSSILNYPQKVAHATAIFIIAPVSVAGAITYIIQGYFNLSLIIPVSIGNVLGGALGAKLLGLLPKKTVDLVFVLVMLSAGIRMMF